MNQQLIAASQLFLIPISILFAALGVARTEALKTLVSGLGVGVSVIWVCRVYRWAGFLSLGDKYTGLGLAIIFLVATVISLVVHGLLWWPEIQRRGFLDACKTSP
jgi:hypothetical protein